MTNSEKQALVLLVALLSMASNKPKKKETSILSDITSPFTDLAKTVLQNQ